MTVRLIVNKMFVSDCRPYSQSGLTVTVGLIIKCLIVTIGLLVNQMFDSYCRSNSQSKVQ